MSVAGIESVITTRFLSALASSGGSTTGSSLTKAPSQDSVTVALNTGLRAYVAGVQGLNTAASFVNLARSDLGRLSDLVKKMREFATAASKSGTGAQARSEADNRIQRLGKEFEKLVTTAKFQDQNYLSKDGLAGLLTNFGLDATSSKSISDSFDRFVVPATDDSLASEQVEPDRSIVIPDDAYTTPVSVSRKTNVTGDLFDTTRRIKNRPDAYQFLQDLSALDKQINKNEKALDNLQDVIGQNLQLVRGTGLAFLAQSQSQLDNPQDAEEVARQLRIKIRQNAGAAISQADNLQAITVASLLLSQSNSGG